MRFETLSNKHADLLFQFELENRDWFETLIASRGNDFYTDNGFNKHFSTCISDAKLGRAYSGVLIEKGAVVARGNLKGIDTKNKICSVGYRVAKNSIGKGYASYCLAELIRTANTSYSIKELKAQVLDNNPVSKAVLEKLGFKATHHEHYFTEFNGINLGCATFNFVCA
ncbi:GNAT family N-acetyltransferase [Thalassotalea fonticola]|uniref:GNAT family N-acetyltransferase n=1 Tax=Thalassotalea fonticola TaxID=3065649 RepID=A0ABZ0GS49_9GAMM|nr:GNAT family N-acetyltransferase [Colwelliaceae bacterium S1-1]